jgi:alkanesulfonate monooxygenase SsuD/methylene tetrahydromethanopterin reductase-like flavin-dependent oxidoreductase (luciferase family)
MRFGIFDHMEKRGSPLHQLYGERLDYLERVDRAGFWAYFKSEHHLTPLDAAPCPSVLLAAAAQRTSRIRLVPLVYLLPFHHPLRLVEEIAMLDHLSLGRLEVGVGRGIAPPEHQMWGLDPDLARDRSEETLDVVLQAFGTDRLDFSGRYWSFEDVPIEMHPYQQPYPPLWYPGNVEIAARRGFNTVVGGSIRAVAAQAGRYRELFEEHRDDVGRVNPGVEAPVIAGAIRAYVAPTDAEAVERGRRAWAAYTHNITLLWRRAGIAPSDMPADPSVGGDFDKAMAVGAAVVGSPERVRDHVERYAAESGTDHLVVSFAWGDLDHRETTGSLDRFVEHVMAPVGHSAAAAG